MNYLELQNECASALEQAGIENFRNESRWLVLETLQLPAAALYSSAAVPDVQISRVRELCSRRCQHEPLQYILGSAPFAELELKVDPHVLIPRSETVCLVEYALEHLVPGGTLLDVGCGSGAIALLAASRRPDIAVTAVDKSPDALNTAKENASLLGVDTRGSFFESDLLKQLPLQKFDVIAANLPYVTFEEYAGLADDVRLYEPEMALTAPDDGMALISELIVSAPEYLKSGGVLVLEMSPPQTARAAAELAANGFTGSEIFADQFGKKRFVAGRFQ